MSRMPAPPFPSPKPPPGSTAGRPDRDQDFWAPDNTRPGLDLPAFGIVVALLAAIVLMTSVVLGGLSR